jgi:hypothetical protein
MNAGVVAANARLGVIEEDDRILVFRASCLDFDLGCMQVKHIWGLPASRASIRADACLRAARNR